jgi:hypothetical protein
MEAERVRLPMDIKIAAEVEPLGGERTRLSVYAVHGKARALLAAKEYDTPEKAWKKLAAIARGHMMEIGLQREVVSDGT